MHNISPAALLMGKSMRQRNLSISVVLLIAATTFILGAAVTHMWIKRAEGMVELRGPRTVDVTRGRRRPGTWYCAEHNTVLVTRVAGGAGGRCRSSTGGVVAPGAVGRVGTTAAVGPPSEPGDGEACTGEQYS